MPDRGLVAAGHPETAAAAAAMLQAGGNAFDAAMAAMLAACVCEPMLCSLGGGGFLLAKQTGRKPELIDFFTQTPISKRNGGLEFFPIHGNFGEATQEFHIGRGAIATPGSVAGLFHIQEAFCRLPPQELIQPAVTLARDGHRINSHQAYTLEILQPILTAGEDCRNIFFDNGRLLREGDLLRMKQFADFLEVLAGHGPDLFYRGEIAALLDRDCRDGGHLSRRDLETYRVIRRRPLKWLLDRQPVWTNPAPSNGGRLIAASASRFLECIAESSTSPNPAYFETVYQAQQHANRMRQHNALDGDDLPDRWQQSRGTTHISVIDSQQNIAALTLSNGEGCGYTIPGTGVMMNNMLGEEDTQPDGFHQWPVNTRIASMMSPSIARLSDGRWLALGSGGSNRIRSAILQVLLRRAWLRQNLADAVNGPRLHLERDLLSYEDCDWPEGMADTLRTRYPDAHAWPERNLFFGGVHSVEWDFEGGDHVGIGDRRRGGHALTI